MVRFFFRLAVWLRFLVAFGCLLVPFGGALGVVLGLWKASWGRFSVSGCILMLLGAAKKHLLVDSTHEGSAMTIH